MILLASVPYPRISNNECVVRDMARPPLDCTYCSGFVDIFKPMEPKRGQELVPNCKFDGDAQCQSSVIGR